MAKGLLDDQSGCTCKKDGTGFLEVTQELGRKKVSSMSGDLLAVVVFGVRNSEVNGVDAAYNLPHQYIFALSPFVDNAKPTEYNDNGRDLFHWARVHKAKTMGDPNY